MHILNRMLAGVAIVFFLLAFLVWKFWVIILIIVLAGIFGRALVQQ